MKRHIASCVPNSFCRIHTCIRPSFETRTGKLRGIIAVPCLEVTTNCGDADGFDRSTVVAVAALLRIPAVRGCWSWPAAGKDRADDKTERKDLHCRYRDLVIAASFHAPRVDASYIHMRCNSFLRWPVTQSLPAASSSSGGSAAPSA